jgi:hypothetical protein
MGTSSRRQEVTTMQPIAAYYVFVANESARQSSARHQYRSIPPKRTPRRAFVSVLGAIVRPLRGSASAA